MQPLLGVDYYPEHWPEARWSMDARLMAEAGLSVVRLAEFAWALLEPAEGACDWGWLDRAIAALADPPSNRVRSGSGSRRLSKGGKGWMAWSGSGNVAALA